MALKRCYGCMKIRSQSAVCEHCGFTDQPNLIHQLPMGVVLKERYLIGRVLGQGGFGITYIGWDGKAGIPIAIKEFFPSAVVHRQTKAGLNVTSYSGESSYSFEKTKARFSKEAHSMLQMKGLPEIVQVMDFFEENNTAYIVMEYVEGITLKSYIKQLGKKPEPKHIIELLKPLVKALAQVHSLQLIHRDISPDNIMLPVSGGVKLIDFGTVRFLDDTNLSKSTEAILKPGFAPLEQYQSHGNIGPWTDVYALCATVYYCITGSVPPDAPSRTVEEPTVPLFQNIPGLEPRIAAALEMGMAVRASHRFQNVDALYKILYEPVVKPQENTSGRTQPEPKAEGKPAPAKSADEAKKPTPRKRKKGRGLICLCLIVCMIAGVLYLTGSDTPDSDIKTTGDTSSFSTNGTTVPDGWLYDSENLKWYYIENGEPVTGWKYINGQRYYFLENGYRAENTTVDIDGDLYKFNVYGRLIYITHQKVDSFDAGELFYFESSHGDIRDVTYRELNRPFENCTGLEFSVSVSDLEYGKPEGTWRVCLRVNGQWVRYDTFEVSGSSGTVQIHLRDPITFDAFTAFRETAGAFRGHCEYDISAVVEKCN